MEDYNQNNEFCSTQLFKDLELNTQNSSTNNENKSLFSNIEPILKKEEDYHYLCRKCHIFPFIEFTKSKKNIKFTCLCYNNKEILIQDLFDKSKNYITINSLSDTSFLSSINVGCYDNCKGLKCIEHYSNFKYYCKTCLLNICQSCKKSHEFYPHEIFDLESIIIDNKKLDEIITNINPNDNIKYVNINENIENIKLNPIKDNLFEKITEEEENKFNKLIRIIINDYKNYPNYSHIFNVKNIFYHFLDLNDNKTNIIEKECNNEYLYSNEMDEIIIKYINNNSSIKIFSEEFVTKNKYKVNLEIDG